MSIKARLVTDLRDTGEIEAEAALLIADDKVFAAADEAQAFALWVRLTEWLATHAQPSRAWQVLLRAAADGRVAQQAAARAAVAPDYTDASTVLNIVKEELGADAYAKVRQAIADRLLGKPRE